MAKKKAVLKDQNEHAAALKNVLEELQTIRQLMLLMILKFGGTAGEIGAALGVTQQRVSQMIPASKIQKLDLAGDSAQ